MAYLVISYPGVAEYYVVLVVAYVENYRSDDT
jgi:hypothetical protein